MSDLAATCRFFLSLINQLGFGVTLTLVGLRIVVIQ
jgi:hypothetical protein